MSRARNPSAVLMAFTAITLFGLVRAQAVGSKDLFRCRQSCYQKFVHDWHHCMDFEDCKNMCITPPNINSYIPEAFSFLCWNNCDQQLGPFPLNINSALRQGSLVLTDIAWDQAITNASKQCLVTWEVSGGGLMGNLLTDSSAVELSLWSDTVYHVQVTCKHKETGGMRRSYKLIVDTHKLSDSTATGMQAITMETGFGKNLAHIYGQEALPSSSGETDSRLRILKDSSKDFLTPYDPNASAATRASAVPAPAAVAPASEPKSTLSAKLGQRPVAPGKQAGSAGEQSASVLRTRLSEHSSLAGSTDLLDQSLVFAVVGSAVLFVGLLVLFILLRPARKDLPVGALATAAAVDKEVLIQSEMLPSQTPVKGVALAVATSSTSCPSNSPAQSQYADGDAAAAAAADVGARTLHV